MNINNFEFIRKFMENETAIIFDQSKEYLVEGRLKSISNELGYPSLDALIQDFKSHPKEEIKLKIIDAMTINETLFFRDIHPFERLKAKIFPELIASNTDKHLNIWCAAASTGQEPYTIAMIIKELSSSFSGWTINIIASDICEKVLSKAREGIYNQSEVNRGLPAYYLMKYFKQKGTNWQINSEIREMVQFKKINLKNPWELTKMDLIFMRNVLIYFNIDTKKDIVKRVESTLVPTGYLFLGAAETTMGINEQFQRSDVDKAPCYQLKKSH